MMELFTETRHPMHAPFATAEVLARDIVLKGVVKMILAYIILCCTNRLPVEALGAKKWSLTPSFSITPHPSHIRVMPLSSRRLQPLATSMTTGVSAVPAFPAPKTLPACTSQNASRGPAAQT